MYMKDIHLQSSYLLFINMTRMEVLGIYLEIYGRLLYDNTGN